MQISESHCGPAVIQMLLGRLGIKATQDQIAEEGGATSLIEMNGMRVDQLALAVHRIAPQVYFYYKDNCSIHELVHLVNDYHTPAGVEWQGLFEDDDEDDDGDEDDGDTDEQNGLPEDSESEDDDYGHYSLVVKADRRKRQLIITDPYKDYFSQARVFDFDQFDQRWYDYNEVPNLESGASSLIKDDHLLFIVVPRNITFPVRVGMRSFSW